MPKATTFDDDMSFDEPVRKRTPRKPRAAAAAKRKSKSRRPRVDMMKVARIAGIGMTVTVGVGIVVNALMMQKGHHPAPLFGRQIALAQGAPVPSAKPVRVASPAKPEAQPSAAEPALPTEPHHDLAKATDGSDPIAALLRTGTPPSSNDHANPKTVLGVQHALVKLGFALKPNGVFGPSTHKAIQSFEKERHLPVSGELSRRLVKVLSAESGIRID